MENIETPTQMSVGIPQNVSAQTPGFGDNSESDFASGTSESINNTDIPNESEEADVNVSTIDSNTNVSDLLLQSAKEEGFEEALTRLANDDLGSENEAVETKEEIIGEESDAQEVKIKELETKISGLIQENENLQDKLLKAEDRVDMSQEIIMEMLRTFYEMAKKEEDEKKKISFLEILISLVGLFMQSIIDPESEKKPIFEKPAEPVEKKPNLVDMMQYLKEQGVKVPPQQMKTKGLNTSGQDLPLAA